MFRAFILVAPILAVVIHHDEDKLWNWLKDPEGGDAIDAVLKDDKPAAEAAPASTESSAATTTDSSYKDILGSSDSAPAVPAEPAHEEVYHPPAAEMNFGSSSSGSSRMITISLDSQFIQGGKRLRGA